MKKFRFRLQPLLRLRRQQENERKRAVGALLAESSEQQRQAVEMAAAVAQEGHKLKQQYLQGVVDADWAGHYRRYVTHMQQAIDKRIRKVAEIQHRLIQARRELTEAAKQTKILEKLKERRRSRYDMKMHRQDRAEQDEIAVGSFIRAGGSD